VSFKSSIGSGKTNESKGNYKKEACVARKHLKKRGSEDHQKLTSSVKVRKTTRKGGGGLNCVFKNFFLYVLKNCSQIKSLT